MTEHTRSEDPIELLRDQIRAATDAAERLVREARPTASGPEQQGTPRQPGPRPRQGPPPRPRQPPPCEPPPSEPPGSPPGGSGPPPGSGPPYGGTPPSGWDAPESHREAASEIEALGTLFRTVRDLLPEDIQQQVSELIRQLLLLLRALIDWAVSRIEGGPRGRDVQVEDIPII